MSDSTKCEEFKLIIEKALTVNKLKYYKKLGFVLTSKLDTLL